MPSALTFTLPYLLRQVIISETGSTDTRQLPIRGASHP